jgi:hypothetical protein
MFIFYVIPIEIQALVQKLQKLDDPLGTKVCHQSICPEVAEA